MDSSTIVFELDNISNYILDITQNKLIIKHNITALNLDNINDFDYANSVILECKINTIDVNKLKYKSIMLEILKYLKTIKVNFRDVITMNYQDGIKTINGYHYDYDLNISIQSKDSKGTLTEIVNIIKKTNISFYIKIKLINNQIIYFNK